jgi:hypothetical protein
MAIGFTAKLEKGTSHLYDGPVRLPAAGQPREDGTHAYGDPLPPEPMEQFKVWGDSLMEREPRTDGIAFYTFVRRIK